MKAQLNPASTQVRLNGRRWWWLGLGALLLIVTLVGTLYAPTNPIAVARQPIMEPIATVDPAAKGITGYLNAHHAFQAKVRDATYDSAPVQSSGAIRFAEMKEHQAEAREPLANTRAMPATVRGQDRFAALKERQAEQRDATFVPASAPASSGAERFAALKEHQVEQHDPAVVTVVAQASNEERFAAFKQMQAELHELGGR